MQGPCQVYHVAGLVAMMHIRSQEELRTRRHTVGEHRLTLHLAERRHGEVEVTLLTRRGIEQQRQLGPSHLGIGEEVGTTLGIVHMGLHVGGIERSLIDLLTHLDYSLYDVDLFLLEEEGELIEQLPSNVHLICANLSESYGPFIKSSITNISRGKFKLLLARIIIGVIVIIINLTVLERFDNSGWIRFAIYTATTVLLTYDVTWRVIKHIKNLNNIIDHNLLITIAVMGATALAVIHLLKAGEEEHGVHFAMEAMMVVGLFQVGQIVEKIATNRSKLAVMNAIQLRVEYANLLKDGEVRKVDPEELEIGDNVVISAGEMIPVDGEVVSGSAYVDKSSLTGEFVPVLTDLENSEVFAGCLVKTGSITIKVNKKYEDSAVAKIIELISNSGEKKSKADEFIAKFAKWYTPAIVIISALVLVIGGIITQDWSEFVVRGLEILVTGCPCAIVISVPLAYFASVGLASKKGIVIKGTNYLDQLNNVDKIVTDKTGTLTHGVFTITKVANVDGVSEEELLNALYAAESLSTHPIAKAITHDVDVKALAAKQVDYKEIAGFGVQTTYEGEVIYAGNAQFMRNNGVEHIEEDAIGTIVHCKKGDKYLGYIVLYDEVKKEAYEMVKLLHKEKKGVVLLTGDKKENADYIKAELGLDRVYSELTPDQKTEILEREMSVTNRAVAFVGDGINDAPSIMRADVGIAMGAIGSDIAVENADVVIMNDDPAKVYEAVKIARIARHTAIFNIVFALFVKFVVAILVLILGSKYIPMIVPVLADTGLTVVLVINSLLILYRKLRK